MPETHRPEGGQPGNQNARRHGLYSRANPPDPDQLRDRAGDALRAGDRRSLQQLARVYAFHGDRQTARALRQAATQLARGRIVKGGTVPPPD